MLSPFLPFAPRFPSIARSWSVVCATLGAAVAALAQSPSAADGFDPNVDGNVYAVAVQADGKILVAGQFATLRPGVGDAASHNNLARVNPDGSLDLSFDPNANGAVHALVLQPDGKILIGGEFTALQPNGATTLTTRNHVARLNANGTLDTTFDPNVGGGLTPQVNAILVQADGRIVIGGGFTTVQPNGAATSTTRNRIARLNANGTLDAAFNPNANNIVFALAQHLDGKILVGGGFTSFQANGASTVTTRNRIARLNPDGTPDSQFDPSADNRALAFAVQRDGKIVVGGDFATLQPNGATVTTACSRLARLNSDGTLDTAFNGNASGSVTALLIQPDGRLLVGGAFNTVWSAGGLLQNHRYLARFNPDGTLDSGFDAGVNNQVDTLAVQADGQLVIGGFFTGLAPAGSANSVVRNRLARISSAGQLEATLNLDASGRPLASAVQADGKILIGGSFTSIGGVTHNRMARLNPDGSVDATFNPNFDERVLTIRLQPDGKILVGGVFTTIGGEPRNHFARLNPSGTIDSEFNPNVNGPVSGIALQADGKILLCGSFTSLHPLNVTLSVNRFYIARLNADGTLDNSFDPDANNTVAAIALQSDGKILIGGTFTTLNPNNTFTTDSSGVVTFTSNHTVGASRFARLNTDGTLDTTYTVGADDQIGAIAIQPDGKVVIAGLFSALHTTGGTQTASRLRVARLNADGSLDAAFDPKANAPVATVALQTDGKILLGGPFTTLTPNGASDYTVRKYAARLKVDGTVDSTFDLDLNEELGSRVDSLVVQPDGRILIAGTFTSLQPVGSAPRIARNHFARITATGSLDTSFQAGVGGSAGGQINALAVQADGKIVAAGLFSSVGGTTSTNIARFYATGAPDTTFSPTLGTDGPVNALLLRTDATTTIPQGRGFAWLNADGTVRAGFAPALESRLSGVVNAAVRQPDGNIIVGGAFTTPTAGVGSNLARFTPAGVIDPTFLPNPGGTVSTIVVQPNGKIVIGGGFTSVGGVGRNFIARLNADGTVDTAFDPNASARVNAILVQPDGKILVAGAFTTLNPNATTTTTTTTASAPAGTVDGTKSTTATNANGSTTTTTVTTVSGITTTTVVTTSAGPVTRNYVARLNPADGSLDTGFNPNPGGSVSAMVLQADGKIVLGGSFNTVAPLVATTTTTTPNAGNSTTTKTNADGTTTTTTISTVSGTTTTTVSTSYTRNFIVRVNADGSPDSGYDPNFNDAVISLALQPDGRVLAGGNFTTVQPNGATANTPRNHLARLNTDGTLDAAFNPSPSAAPFFISVQTDGKILLGGAFTTLQPNGATVATTRNRIARVNADGTLDLTFNPDADSIVNVVAAQPDGTIIAGGFFTSLQPNASLLVGGAFNNIGGVPSRNLALLNDDGTVGGAFQPNPNGAVNALLAQPDGRTVVGGAFTNFAGATRNRLARLNADNTLDPAFNPGANGPVNALALQSDGKIVVGGVFTTIGGQTRNTLARLNADGTVDASFTSAPFFGVTGIVVQPDGHLLVAGSGSGVPTRLLRLNADGSLDASFNSAVTTSINSFALQADGRIIVGGSFAFVTIAIFPNPAAPPSYLARLNADGSFDTTFNPLPNGTVTALALQTDGRVLVAGSFSTIGGLQRGSLARLAVSTPVVQTLAANRTTLQWTRSGGGPTLSVVKFELSTDTQTWTTLGQATQVSGTTTWQLGGLSLPATGLFYIRARGIIPTGSGTSSGLIETVREFNLAAVAGVGPASSPGTLDGEGLTVALAAGTLGGANGGTFVSGFMAAKITGAAEEIRSDIVHPNGHVYDQVLLEGATATITADPGQVTRVSFLDLTNDIVQVEFSGAGALSLILDHPSGPAAPVNYNQPGVAYMKGHAGIVITGADETTNVSVFSVGRFTAVDPSLFKTGVTYDGVADIGYLAILSTDGKFGGVRTGNTAYFATSGITGICAPGVQFTGPVYVGDVTAYDAASPMLLLGSAADTEITGGDLWQANGQPVQVSGITQLRFVDGTTSQGGLLPAQAGRSILQQNGADVTAQVEVNPNK